jgi:hypothetical protein
MLKYKWKIRMFQLTWPVRKLNNAFNRRYFLLCTRLMEKEMIICLTVLNFTGFRNIYDGRWLGLIRHILV